MTPTGSHRPSLHVEPTSPVAIAQHYIRDLVYGANDGIITTFAVVAAAAGGALTAKAVLIVGIANLIADGLSMGVGNYLSIRSHESARAAQDLPEEEAHPARHGAATMAAFVAAGVMPLLPYMILQDPWSQFVWSVVFTLTAMFGFGAVRSFVTVDRWWGAGLEMLLLGVVVASAAFGTGLAVAWILG